MRINEFISKVTQSQPMMDPNMIASPSGSNDEINESELRRTNHHQIPCHRFKIEGETFIFTPQDEKEPKNIKEALNCLAKENWKKAMEEDMESMKTNHMWEIVDPPKGRKPIGNKWILKIKCKANGIIERYKARLVAEGYTQHDGIDFEKPFYLLLDLPQ